MKRNNIMGLALVGVALAVSGLVFVSHSATIPLYKVACMKAAIGGEDQELLPVSGKIPGSTPADMAANIDSTKADVKCYFKFKPNTINKDITVLNFFTSRGPIPTGSVRYGGTHIFQTGNSEIVKLFNGFNASGGGKFSGYKGSMLKDRWEKVRDALKY